MVTLAVIFEKPLINYINKLDIDITADRQLAHLLALMHLILVRGDNRLLRD